MGDAAEIYSGHLEKSDEEVEKSQYDLDLHGESSPSNCAIYFSDDSLESSILQVHCLSARPRYDAVKNIRGVSSSMNALTYSSYNKS